MILKLVDIYDNVEYIETPYIKRYKDTLVVQNNILGIERYDFISYKNIYIDKTKIK